MMLMTLSADELRFILKNHGLGVHIGPFVIRIQTAINSIAEEIRLLYADYQFDNNTQFADFHVRLAAPRNIRRWLRPQVDFFLDTHKPFKPLPQVQAYPFFEWGVNWCIAGNAHQYMIIHAATVEKNGCAVIMPGEPGSGKSTLCAALVHRGWRLLSDELTLVSPREMVVVPVPRPVSLKNESIAVLHEFEPQAIIGRSTHDTGKGTVAHMKAPRDSVRRSQQTARPVAIVFPKYSAGADAQLTSISKSHTLMRIVKNTFNYSALDLTGFHTAADLVDACDGYDYRYSRLDDAVADFDQWVSDVASTGHHSKE